MMDKREVQSTPEVSVILTARRHGPKLRAALRSALQQTHCDLEVLLVAPSQARAGETADKADDNRVRLIETDSPLGKAEAMNLAAEQARGEFLCWLDDESVYYPRHVETLLQAMHKAPADTAGVYSDFYCTHRRRGSDGQDVVLSKTVRVSRDFDRFVLMHSNTVLRVTLLARRSVVKATGGVNETLQSLVDWDLARRLALFGDLQHLPVVTGEYAAPPAQAEDGSEHERPHFLSDLLRVRSARPDKPWPAMKDLSVLITPQRVTERTTELLRKVYRWTFIPFRVYLACTAEQFRSLKVDLPNFLHVPVRGNAPPVARLDEAVSACDGDLLAIIDETADVSFCWIEPAAGQLTDQPNDGALLLGSHDPINRPLLIARNDYLRAARMSPALNLRRRLEAAGINAERPTCTQETLFALDRAIAAAGRLEEDGNHFEAARTFRRSAAGEGDVLNATRRAAKALAASGQYDRQAIQLAGQLNRRAATPETLLLEASLHRRDDRPQQALVLLDRARQMLSEGATA
ncbi:MAG: glycosyltransferase [Phycisphaerae bacterium]